MKIIWHVAEKFNDADTSKIRYSDPGYVLNPGYKKCFISNYKRLNKGFR